MSDPFEEDEDGFVRHVWDEVPADEDEDEDWEDDSVLEDDDFQ